MKKILELISEEMQKAFEEAGYNKELGKVTVSNRPDLCEYQCNGAMAGAKQYKKAPIMIANEVVEKFSTTFRKYKIIYLINQLHLLLLQELKSDFLTFVLNYHLSSSYASQPQNQPDAYNSSYYHL